MTWASFTSLLRTDPEYGKGTRLDRELGKTFWGSQITEIQSQEKLDQFLSSIDAEIQSKQDLVTSVNNKLVGQSSSSSATPSSSESGTAWGSAPNSDGSVGG